LAQLAPLGLNLGYLAIQIVGFLLLVLALNAIIYRPLLNALANRRERIAEGLNQAREAETSLARAEADRQKLLDEARKEAQTLTQEARSRAEEAGRAIEAEARQEASRIREAAQAEAATERDRQLADVREQIVSLSIAAANHLLGQNLDEKRQRELVQDFFTNVPANARTISGENVTVITAVPLADAEKQRFTKELGGKNVTFRTDPAILGGVVVRSGAQEVDASFRNQLTEMRASLS
jgi:F-type H+-transporting ATPase subunit b